MTPVLTANAFVTHKRKVRRSEAREDTFMGNCAGKQLRYEFAKSVAEDGPILIGYQRAFRRI